MNWKNIGLIIISTILAGLFLLYSCVNYFTSPRGNKINEQSIQKQIEAMAVTLPSSVVLPPPEGDEGKKTLLGIDSSDILPRLNAKAL